MNCDHCHKNRTGLLTSPARDAICFECASDKPTREERFDEVLRRLKHKSMNEFVRNRLLFKQTTKRFTAHIETSPW